eukprot:707909-Hanusia_phi.AAC.1
MESFADYYAIIRTMEKLETQYIRGTIAPDVYEKECQKLLPRFSTLKECLPSDMQVDFCHLRRLVRSILQEFVSRTLPWPSPPSCQGDARCTIGSFSSRPIKISAESCKSCQQESRPHAQLAVGKTQARLLSLLQRPFKVSSRWTGTADGFPPPWDDSSGSSVNGIQHVDAPLSDFQVHPLTADVVNALNKIAQLPADFEPKMKVKSWLQILSAMRATEVLDENQTREFLRDMENSHQTFVHWLQSRNT